MHRLAISEPGNSDYSRPVGWWRSRARIWGSALTSLALWGLTLAPATPASADDSIDRLGVAIYDGGDDDAASDVVVSPDGSHVYVTGWSGSSTPPGSYPNYDYATVAYDVATGTQSWVARYDGG